MCTYLWDVVERGDGEADGEHVPPPSDRLEGEDHGVHPLHVDADRHAHGANPARGQIFVVIYARENIRIRSHPTGP